MSIRDTDLHLLPWEPHSGPDIGGVPPTYFGAIRPTPDTQAFIISEPANANGLWAVHRPVCVLPAATSALLTLVLSIKIDAALIQFGRCLEMDSKTAWKGWMYDGSFQINIAEGWMLQVTDAGQKWKDTGTKIPPLVPYAWNLVTLKYAMDFAKHTRTYVGVSINGMSAPLGQVYPATPTTWADSASCQIQLDLGDKGGTCSVEIEAPTEYQWD
jgi:hypothetical protein